MIPKIIHFVWFGKSTFTSKVKKCIDSWKKYLPDYEFMLWDESNFEIDNSCQFVKDAYALNKFAFVSDYVRFYALYKFGGIYLDTDVEVIKPFDHYLFNQDVTLVLDDGGYISGSTIASKAGSLYIKDCLEYYHQSQFILNNGRYNIEVINSHMQNRLYKYGYSRNNMLQSINYKNETCKLYPDDYFHVRSLTTGVLNKSNNSYAIHWHTILWTSKRTKIINFIRINILCKLIGKANYNKITKVLKRGKTTI